MKTPDLMGVNAVISKNERVIEYIAKLEAGEKVSVRKLAEILKVSEGTAYKSIKQAEAQGLVVTKPKVGTVRINLRSENDEGDVTLAEALRSVGAVCLHGAELAADIPMPYMVLGDGDIQQFEKAVNRVSGEILCIVGDRPSVQELALSCGCHILLTGGAMMDVEMMAKAEKSRICVFASEQDSSTLLSMMKHRIPADFSHREMGLVRDWMQMPRYLYSDDMVTEWYRLYSDLYYRSSDCTVVDENLRICGSVEAMAAMNAAPTLQLSEIMDPPKDGSYVSEDMSMEELAELFVKSDRFFTSVNSHDGMSGFIGMGDVIRYFLYNRSYRLFDTEPGSRLELSSDDVEGERRMYTLQLGDMGQELNRSGYINSIYSAAAWHAYALLGRAVELDSGSINTLERIRREGEYLISSNLLRRNGDELLLELELFNDQASYAKASLRYRAAD